VCRIPICARFYIDHGKLPSATGSIARLACARAEEEGIAVESLLKNVGLTRQQIDNHTLFAGYDEGAQNWS